MFRGEDTLRRKLVVNLAQKLRKLWHDAYYALAPQSAQNFAMRCRDVAAQVDFPESVDSPLKKWRHSLHMSLCEACRNYEGYSRWLTKEAAQVEVPAADASRVEKLNAHLLETHSKKKLRDRD